MRGVNLLSEKAIQAGIKRAGKDRKAVALNDGEGLTLECQPSGAAWWRLRYWVGGKANRLSVGTYPATTLAQARKRRDEARQGLASGTDPSDTRKAEKAARKAEADAQARAAAGEPMPGTFAAVAAEWLQKVHRAKVTPAYAERSRLRLEQEVLPWLGTRPLNAIEPPELLACLRRVEARGAIETAHRVKDTCGQVFRYGVATGQCTRNPAADLRGALTPHTKRHYAALVEPAQVAPLLRDIAAYSGHPVTRAALALAPLLLLRPGELRHLEWAWLDTDAATLTLPPWLMKRRKEGKLNGAPHLVPLAPQALAVLQTLQPLTGHGRYIFPALTTGERCMSENTVRSALRRMGYTNDEMTGHGFRAMARTMAAERLGIAPEVIEAQLAHTVPDALGRAYNRTQYLAQRRELMAKWADYLDTQRADADVVQLRRGVG